MRLSDEIGAASEDLRRLSAIVISLQRQAQIQGPELVVGVSDASAKSVGAPILAPHATWIATHALALGQNGFQFLILIGMLLVGLGFGFALERSSSLSSLQSAPWLARS